MPCPHHDIKIVQRSNRQSAVAAAAYQSGEDDTEEKVALTQEQENRLRRQRPGLPEVLR